MSIPIDSGCDLKNVNSYLCFGRIGHNQLTVDIVAVLQTCSLTDAEVH